MNTHPRTLALVRFALAAALGLALVVAGAAAAVVGAQASPTTPTVPSSKGLIPASDAMPSAGEAAHITTNCYTSGQSGGSIPEATVLARAAVWVNQNVPYTGQCAQEPGGNYRLDCSGFVSMAWGLSTSLSTYDFNPAINGGDPRFVAISRANLQPGDAVVADNSRAHHIALFTGWGSNDNGQHRYANLSEESDFNVGTIAITNQDLLGSYWGMFTPIRYTNVIHAAMAGVSALFINGGYHVFWISPTGQLVQTYYASGWHTITLGGTGLSGSPSATYHPGRLDVFATSGNGTLYQMYYDTAWHALAPIQSGWQPGVGAVWDGTANHVFGHNSAGHLLQATVQNGTWQSQDLGGTTAGAPAVTFQSGRYTVWAVAPSTNRLYQLQNSNGVWSGWLPATMGTYALSGAAALWIGTTPHIFSLSLTSAAQESYWVSGWYGPNSLGGSYRGAPSAGWQGGQLNVFAVPIGGGLLERTYANRAWGSWQAIA